MKNGEARTPEAEAERRRRISEGNRGQKRTPEQIARIRAGARAYWSSPEGIAERERRARAMRKDRES